MNASSAPHSPSGETSQTVVLPSLESDLLRRYLDEVELPPLLATLADLTGDDRYIADSLRPPLHSPLASGHPNGGMSVEATARAKDLAYAALRNLLSSAEIEPHRSTWEETRKIAAFVTNEEPTLTDATLRQEINWPEPEPAGAKKPISVAVVGAGVSGLAIAKELQRRGISYQVFESNDNVGGVWYISRYPGCRLDTTNFSYSYSYSPKKDWQGYFATRAEIWNYLEDFALKENILPQVVFNTTVTRAIFDESSATWRVSTHGPEGDNTRTYDAVVWATGQLNRPKFPDVPGVEDFAGESWHSGAWPDDGLDRLQGKRVALIGSGASAYQVGPGIVSRVEQLVVFQRSAPWTLDAPTYYDDLPEGQRWFLEQLPEYAKWHRYYLFAVAAIGRIAYAAYDPEWKKPGSVSQANETLRIDMERFIKRQYEDRPDLWEKVVPDYAPGSKRMVRDNGVWPEMIKNDKTELVTEPIIRIDESGIITKDGNRHDVDAIVYCTGFRASEFNSHIPITGRNGISLADYWAGDAKAYLGIHVPNFPNMFFMLGPNINLVLNGSIIFFAEAAAKHIGACLVRASETVEPTAVEVSQDTLDFFVKKLDAASEANVWGSPQAHSWYKNSFGRVVAIWPFTMSDYLEWTSTLEGIQFSPALDK